MKRLHLGKILIVLFLPIYLMATTIKASLDKPLIYRGDSVVLSIEADANDPKFPEIDEIGGFRVLGTSQSQSITSINGKTSQKITKSYTFAPTKSIDIPPFEVEVDGKKYKTSPLKLKVQTPKQTGKNSPVQLEMKLSKNSSYVAEPITLDIFFKREPNREFAKVEIIPPDLKSFWAKKLPDSPPYSKDGYIIQKYSYLLSPQKKGEFTIPAAIARLGIKNSSRSSRAFSGAFDDPFFNDPFFNLFPTSSIKWQKIFSNDVTLNVKALPDNLDLYGDFQIEAKVDKKSIKANKPLNLTIIVKGEGNLDDIKKFSLDIDDAIVYADEPIVKTVAKDGTYQGVFSQKIAIVADKNYTIPSFSLAFLDKNSSKKRVVKTNPIDIEVTGSLAKNSNNKQAPTKITESSTLMSKQKEDSNNDIQKDPKESKESSFNNYIYLLLGALMGGLIGYLFAKRGVKKVSKKEIDIIKKIEKTKNNRELFELLLPYSNRDKRIKNELDKLERNIYKNEDIEIDKDSILDYFDELYGED